MVSAYKPWIIEQGNQSVRAGEARGPDGLMATMAACERKRQQTDQLMCHIASLLSPHCAFSSLFFFCSRSLTHSFSYPTCLFFLLLFQPPLMPFHSSLTAFLFPLFRLNGLFSLNALFFLTSLPTSLCHSRQNYYSWMELWLSGAVLCSLRPHYPFMEYPLLWWAIFL